MSVLQQAKRFFSKPAFLFVGEVPVSLKENEDMIQSILMLTRKATVVKQVTKDPPSSHLRGHGSRTF